MAGRIFMARMRTFLALDPGKALHDRILTLQDQLAECGADVKWVEPANLHMTLLFLGEVEDRDLAGICRATAEVAAQLIPFTLTLAGVGCFPNLRRPRVLWVGVGEGREAVCAMHAALESPLLELGCYRREARPFTPHLTLGRVNSEAGNDALVEALRENAAWHGGETTIHEILVMSSELLRTGPLYTVLGRARLQ
jgi:RNA 2',3'-cyclic 3'-phosphodiesterase